MEYKGVCNSKPKVLLMKVTSCSRPQILLDTVSEYIRLANDTRNMVWLISLDLDDETVNEDFVSKLVSLIGLERFSETMSRYRQTVLDNIISKGVLSEHWQFKNGEIVLGISKSKIDAINRDVNNFYLPWDILVCASDDQRPVVKGWDSRIRDAMPDDLDASIWAYDGGQRRINTMEVLGYNYAKRFDFNIYYPGYKSFFPDNEATEVAKKLGKQVVITECLIRHDHYAWNRNSYMTNDSLYQRNEVHWKHDEDLYNERLKNNFGL